MNCIVMCEMNHISPLAQKRVGFMGVDCGQHSFPVCSTVCMEPVVAALVSN